MDLDHCEENRNKPNNIRRLTCNIRMKQSCKVIQGVFGDLNCWSYIMVGSLKNSVIRRRKWEVLHIILIFSKVTMSEVFLADLC